LAVVPKKIFLFRGSEFDFFYFSKRGGSTGESKKMYQAAGLAIVVGWGLSGVFYLIYAFT